MERIFSCSNDLAQVIHRIDTAFQWWQPCGIRDNCAMRWRNPMPRFDFYKDKAPVKLIALALILTPGILLAVAAVVRACQ